MGPVRRGLRESPRPPASMPIVVLPPELATEELSLVPYSNATLDAKPGRASLLVRILQECDVPASEASRWCIVNNTRDTVLDEAALRALSAHARVHLSRVGVQRPPQFVELRNDAAMAQATASGREVQNYISAEPRHDFMDFLGMCVATATHACARVCCACATRVQGLTLRCVARAATLLFSTRYLSG